MTNCIVAAMPVELDCFDQKTRLASNLFQINQELQALVCGIGSINVQNSLSDILQSVNVGGLISWGTAAGLDTCHTGDLIIPGIISGVDGNKIETDKNWQNALIAELDNSGIVINQGPLAESSRILKTPHDKKILHNKTGAVAADMESYTLAKLAQENDIPCLVVRVIVDEANMVLPDQVLRHTDLFGRIKIYRIITEIFKNPRLIMELIRLNAAMKKARNRLRMVAVQGENILGHTR